MPTHTHTQTHRQTQTDTPHDTHRQTQPHYTHRQTHHTTHTCTRTPSPGIQLQPLYLATYLQEFNDSKKKSENINAEFLSLVNKCNLLEERTADLTRDRDGLAKEAESHKRAAAVLEAENVRAVDEARELRAAVIQLEAHKMNFEAQLKHQEVGTDGLRNGRTGWWVEEGGMAVARVVVLALVCGATGGGGVGVGWW